MLICREPRNIQFHFATTCNFVYKNIRWVKPVGEDLLLGKSPLTLPCPLSSEWNSITAVLERWGGFKTPKCTLFEV